MVEKPGKLAYALGSLDSFCERYYERPERVTVGLSASQQVQKTLSSDYPLLRTIQKCAHLLLYTGLGSRRYRQILRQTNHPHVARFAVEWSGVGVTALSLVATPLDLPLLPPEGGVAIEELENTH